MTPARPASEAELFARFDALGLAFTTHRHPAVFTVAESGAVKETIPGAHTKNLFLKDKKGELALISAQADVKIDLNAAAALAGLGRPSFGGPALLMETLGVAPGSVTVFALVNDRLKRVRCVLDAGLLAHDLVNFHPLANTATTGMSPRDLLRFLDSIGRRPTLLAFGADGTPRLVQGAEPDHLGSASISEQT